MGEIGCRVFLWLVFTVFFCRWRGVLYHRRIFLCRKTGQSRLMSIQAYQLHLAVPRSSVKNQVITVYLPCEFVLL